MNLHVEKVSGSYCVMAGKSALGKFSTEAKAQASMANDKELYAYWAGSASVSIENTEAKIVCL